MTLDIRHIRVIIAVAEETNFTRAASRLGIPQPALSTQVRRIERVLGAPLFARSTRSVALTEHGARILPLAHAVDAAMKRFEEASRSATSATEKTVRIATHSLSLANALDDLQRRVRFPPLHIAIVESDASLEAFGLREFDFIQAYEQPGGTLRCRSGLRMATVVDEPLWALLPPRHPLRSETPARLMDLAGEDWISQPPGSAQHDLLLRVCQSTGFAPNIRCYAMSESVALQLVRRGRYVSLGSPITPGAEDCAQPLDIDVTRQMLVAWNPATCQPPMARTLHDVVRRWYRDRARENPAYWEQITTRPHRYRSLLLSAAE